MNDKNDLKHRETRDIARKLDAIQRRYLRSSIFGSAGTVVVPPSTASGRRTA